MTTLDEIDHQLIALLRRDGRATYAELGARVGLSSPAAKRRVDRLVATGVITGFAALVDEAALGHPLEAFTELRFAGDTRVADIAGVARDIPEVQAVFTLAGDPDAVVWMRVRDTGHLATTIDRLRRSGRITETKTMMILHTWRPADDGAPARGDD